MSQENVEAVQRAWEAWEHSDMDALFDFYAPDIEWDQTRFPEYSASGVYRGHDGIRRFFRQWLSPFREFYAHAEEFTDAGDCVVVRVRQGARGKESGAVVEMAPYWQVYRLRNGQAVRIEVYRDEADALDAVGLRE